MKIISPKKTTVSLQNRKPNHIGWAYFTKIKGAKTVSLAVNLGSFTQS